MKQKACYLLSAVCSLLFMPSAFSAGTYYTGSYQSPQQRYTGTSSYSGYQSSQQNYYRPVVAQQTRTVQQPRPQQASSNQNTESGLWLDAGLSHEMGQWGFEMANSGSVLNYDNLAWNVLDVKGGYIFNRGSATVQIDAGFKYGMQSGESPMIDDDITNGGYLVSDWCESIDENGNCVGYIGSQMGHALSVGTSSGGNMMGFNAGIGLTDFFAIGNMKITPSVGYRYFSHKLETKNNYGLSLDTAGCFEVNGEIQCDPAIIVIYDNGTQQIIWRGDANQDGQPDGMMDQIADGVSFLDPTGTYYYRQPGVSHSYETTWAGPYLALDADYVITRNNTVNARIELGLPGYSSIGDQPYRFDWAHPKSVEDTAGMGSAMHLGLAANWQTALTDAVMLSIGLTYDYYSVSGADAKTYLNSGYYMGVYNEAQAIIDANADTKQVASAQEVQNNIDQLREECPGWVCSRGNEVDSLYKSMGIRVGLAAKF
jgi:hypothetical protein